MRHFKVDDKCHKLVFNSKEIDIWVDKYDQFSLIVKDIELPYIDKVYTSDLDRAKRSAKHLKVDFESNQLFNEVSTKAFINTNLKFPKIIWLIAGRVLWSLGFIKKSESKKQTYKRAKEAIDFLLKSNHEYVMIISHGFFMRALADELKHRNFEGKIDKAPKNGKIYTFTKY
jgi:broad specificity phosphatase PhoE